MLKQRDLLEEIEQEKTRLSEVANRNDQKTRELEMEILEMSRSYFSKGVTYGDLERKIKEYMVRTGGK